MPRNNAKNQQAFRERQKDPHNENPKVRLDIYVDFKAKLAVDRLARHWGITKKQAIEKALLETQEAITYKMTHEEFSEYHKY